MRAGKLREVISIQQEAIEPNGSGGFQGGWIELKQTRAQVTRLRGSRGLSASQLVFDEPYEIVTRYRIDVPIGPTLKIAHRGKDIILHSVLEEDFRHHTYKYFGYADSKGEVNDGSAPLQLYEDNTPQKYEDGSFQYYEG